MTDHRSLDWAIEIIGMCEPIRCVQGGIWFGRNNNFADAAFVDYGAADAFAVAGKALPDLVKALREAERFMAYFSNETDGVFVGSGTPASCLKQIRDALGATAEAGSGAAVTGGKSHD
jgi:hypothetical protein